VVKGKAGLRDNLRQAKDLLTEAGWTIRDGKLVNAEGKVFSFEILLSSATSNGSWPRM